MTNLFPEPAALVELDPSPLATPQTRRNTLTASELYVGSSEGSPDGAELTFGAR